MPIRDRIAVLQKALKGTDSTDAMGEERRACGGWYPGMSTYLAEADRGDCLES